MRRARRDARELKVVSLAMEGNVDAVKRALAGGAAVDARSGDGFTPLMSAASQQRLEMVRFLLARGADVNALDHDGKTPLRYALDGMRRPSFLADSHTDFDAVIRLLRDAKRQPGTIKRMPTPDRTP
jgi:hypothetical protein